MDNETSAYCCDIAVKFDVMRIMRRGRDKDGGFLIAKGMMVNGLDKRITYGIMSMRWVGDSPRRIFLAMGCACMFCSDWISNTTFTR